MNKVFYRAFVFCFLFVPTIVYADEVECGRFDIFPCNFKILSWVEVTIDGDALKEHRREFERLVRLRARNDMPMISHETKHIDTLRKEVGNDESKWHQTSRPRGQIDCTVWTVRTKDPIAFHVKCELWGWGDYGSSIYESFDSEFLGIGPPKYLKRQVDGAIDNIIATISADLLEKRDMYKAKPE